MGHMRFWKMDNTFTGLKLQGNIGKFGHIDISDIYAFAEFGSGKVISGSEPGDFLMWQGGLLQFIIKQNNDEKSPCHNSNIIFVQLTESNNLVSASDDGIFRFWDIGNLEFFEASEDHKEFYIDLTNEVSLSH